MKQKHKFKKLLKLTAISLLLVCMLVSSMPVSFATEAEITGFKINDVQVVKNYDGNWEWDYDENDECYEWFAYNYEYSITGEVYLSDGSTVDFVGPWVEIYYDDYNIELSDDQSYENQWDYGTHQATAELAGFSTTFNVTVIDAPLESLVIDRLNIIEGTCGYSCEDYDFDNDLDVKWYKYDDFDVTGKAVMNDGTEYDISDGCFEYNNKYVYLDFETDQYYDNQWGVGTHTATASCMGVEADFTVNITETPIKSVELYAADIIENTCGFETEDYNPDTDEWDLYWYCYSEFGVSGTVTMKDGTTSEVYNGNFEYNDEYYSFDCSTDQSLDNQWSLGAHTITAKCMGIEKDITVNIIESPYQSLEILSVNKILEQSYYSRWDLNFTYKITYKDGTTEVKTFVGEEDYDDESIDVSIEGDWQVGSDNEFTITVGGITATGYATVLEDIGFSFVEQDGGMYITGCSLDVDDLVIPEEIDGVKVVGVTSFGYGIGAKTITIPDSVKSLGEDLFASCWNLETVTVGSGVEYIDAKMFRGCTELKNVNVSKNNKNYVSVDGVVYNSALDTLVVYPFAKTQAHVIPATVKNVDVLQQYSYDNINVSFAADSPYFKSVDGVTYSNDMSTVIFCSKNKSGEYVMPDSVTKITESAFAGCNNLTDVKISKNVTEITYSAFRSCSSLASVSMPDNLKTIGEEAFAKCESLENVTLPKNLETVKRASFYQSGIAKLAIPDKVKTIGNSAFYETKISELSIGKGIETIGDSAFVGILVNSLDIPDNVKSLGAYCFAYGRNLETVNFGAGLTEISNQAFTGCELLNNVVLPENITKVGRGAFSYCYALNDLEIKGKSVELDVVAFAGCPLENYSPDEGITNYGDSCFRFTNIKSFHAAKTVTEIAYNSFGSCKELSDIQIPDTVLNISSCAFDGSKWYEEQPDGAVYLDHIYLRNKGMNMPSDVEIKDGTKTIADGALGRYFSGPTEQVETVSLPNGLIRIGDLAFSGCTSMREITIPASVEDIGDYAFLGCESLERINVSPDNKYYSSENGVLFNKDKTELIYCPKQASEEYTVPETVKTIKSFAFAYSKVKRLEITSKTTELEVGAVGFVPSIGFTADSVYKPDAFDDMADYDEHVLSVVIVCPKNSAAAEYVTLNGENIDCEYTQSGDDNVLLGDTDLNGKINVKDVTLIQKSAADLVTLTDSQISAADVNADGKVNIKDATAIQKYIAGIETGLDIGK